MADASFPRPQPIDPCSRAPGDRSSPGLVCSESGSAPRSKRDAGVDGRLAPVLAGAVVRDGVPAELIGNRAPATAADLDAINRLYGYPELTAEQLAEVLRADEERWQRSRGTRRRPASSPYRDHSRPLRLR